MAEQYLKAHVHVVASFIENSSNSLGEAMILGVPCVASDVGGTKNMIKHGEEGFLYQSDAPYMLSLYVKMLWEDDDLAMSFSNKARVRALETHDAEKNAKRLMEIYESLMKQDDE